MTPLNYQGLARGLDDTGQFILAPTHGDCVSFAADNTEPARSISINFTRVEIDYNKEAAAEAASPTAPRPSATRSFFSSVRPDE